MDIEIRADGSLHIEGYVNAVERDSRTVICPDCGKCVEQIKAGVFGMALRAAQNINMLLNHDESRKIASTAENTLTLTEDNIGLRATADITDSEVIEKARAGKLRGWSFGFKATSSEIEARADNIPRRIVKGMLLREVSIIDDRYTPCYAGTSIEIRADGSEEECETRVNEVEIHVSEKKPEGKFWTKNYSRYLDILDGTYLHEERRIWDESLHPRRPDGTFDIVDGSENTSNSEKTVDKSGKSDIMSSSNNDELLRQAISSGAVSTKLNKKAQAKHKFNSPEYQEALKRGEFPSYTTLSHMEVQSIINKYSGTGTVNYDKHQFREIIECDKIIGTYCNIKTGEKQETNRATIHYSKKGTHLVPARYKGGNKIGK